MRPISSGSVLRYEVSYHGGLFGNYFADIFPYGWSSPATDMEINNYKLIERNGLVHKPYSREILDYVFDADLIVDYCTWLESEFVYHNWYPESGIKRIPPQYSGDISWYKHSPADMSLVEFVPSSGEKLHGFMAKTIPFTWQIHSRKRFIERNYYGIEDGFESYEINSGSGDLVYGRHYGQGDLYRELVCNVELFKYSTLNERSLSVPVYYAAKTNTEDVYSAKSIGDGRVYLDEAENIANNGTVQYIYTEKFPTPAGSAEVLPDGHSIYRFSKPGSVLSSDGTTVNVFQETAKNINKARSEFASPSGSMYQYLEGFISGYVGEEIIHSQEAFSSGNPIITIDDFHKTYFIKNTSQATSLIGYTDGEVRTLAVDFRGIPDGVVGIQENPSFKRVDYVTGVAGVARINTRMFTSDNSGSLSNKVGWFKDIDGAISSLKASISASKKNIDLLGVGGYRAFYEGEFIPSYTEQWLENYDFATRSRYTPENLSLSDYDIIWDYDRGYKTNVANIGSGIYNILGSADTEIDISPFANASGAAYLTIWPKDVKAVIGEHGPNVVNNSSFSLPTPRYRLANISIDDNPVSKFNRLAKSFEVVDNYDNTTYVTHKYDSPIPEQNFNVDGPVYDLWDITNLFKYPKSNLYPTKVSKYEVVPANGSLEKRYVGELPNATVLAEYGTIRCRASFYWVDGVGRYRYFDIPYHLDTENKTVPIMRYNPYYGAMGIYYDTLPLSSRILSYTTIDTIIVELTRVVEFSYYDLGRKTDVKHHYQIKYTYTFHLDNGEEIASLADTKKYITTGEFPDDIREKYRQEFFSQFYTVLAIGRPVVNGIPSESASEWYNDVIGELHNVIDNGDGNIPHMPGWYKSKGYSGANKLEDIIFGPFSCSTFHIGQQISESPFDSKQYVDSIKAYITPNGYRHIGSVFTIPVSNDDFSTNLDKRVYPSGKITKGEIR